MAKPPNYKEIGTQYVDDNGILYTWNGTQWVETANTNSSFNQIKINNRDNFNSYFDRNLNFEGVNLIIYSGGSNTIVFSAQPQTK